MTFLKPSSDAYLRESAIKSPIRIKVTVFDLIERNAHLHGVSVGNRDSFDAMMAFTEAHGIHPVIAAEYEFDNASAALQAIVRGEHIGKLAVGIGS